MRRNRVTRNAIEDRLGLHAVEAVEHFNDGVPETLSELGVDLSPQEEAAQAAVWDDLAMHELLAEEAA
jgi:hypothetical protein